MRIGPVEVNRPQVIDETIDGEVVAIHLEQGTYYCMRGVAAEIWRGIAAELPLGGIVSGLSASQNAASADVESAVIGFIEELQREGLTRASPDGDRAAAGIVARGTPPAGPGHPFPAPLLEKFTDMEDLLLLDPVHDVDAQGWPQLRPDP